MQREQLAMRLMASMATGISTDQQRRGNIDTHERARLARAAEELRDLPILIDDTAAMTVRDMRTAAQRAMRKGGLDLIIGDYLQLIRPARRSSNEQTNRTGEISQIARDEKELAKELGIPVLELCQLSRLVEQRENKRPTLSDLRESGEIEQAADVVMFLYREAYYLEKEEPTRRSAETSEKYQERRNNWAEQLERSAKQLEIIVSKNRNGATGTVKLFMDPASGRITNLSREDRW
jgi:replicative DNA helicase